jgi:hypothetical protein
MRKRSLKRLAGCIAIELVWACAAHAIGGYDYKVGFASYGHVKALALEDRQGHRAVIATAAFSVPLSVADSIAAQAIKDFKLERANLLIHSVASGDAAPQDANTAIGAALGNMQYGHLVYGNGRLTASSADGRCLAALTVDASLTSCSNPNGDAVRGTIRAAFRIVDQTQGLQSRDDAPRSVALQAIALGGSLVIFSGPSNFAQSGRGIILALTPAVEGDTRLNAAVGEVFLRVGGRPHQ